LAALPFVKDELVGMAEAAFNGVTGGVGPSGTGSEGGGFGSGSGGSSQY
jgi:hypothetical protein